MNVFYTHLKNTNLSLYFYSKKILSEICIIMYSNFDIILGGKVSRKKRKTHTTHHPHQDFLSRADHVLTD